MLLASDSPEGISKSVGLGIIGYAQSFSRSRPDILVVLGDRFEMYAAAVAALPFRIPVAHIHGGELTAGAIDDALRHSMTKLSHLHFVSTEAHGRRVIQMGEEPWRVRVCGALTIDNLKWLRLMAREDLEAQFGLCLDTPPLLVTFHPVTLECDRTAWHIGELLAALEMIDGPIVFTLPNADTSGRTIIREIRTFAATRSRVRVVENFGVVGYFSMMANAAAMIGNSSSGIVEAASFRLPVVNIGTRQQGRVQPKNVIQSSYQREEIAAAIVRAISPGFSGTLADLMNPYGDGHAAEQIVQRLKTVELDQRLLLKHFFDAEACACSKGSETVSH